MPDAYDKQFYFLHASQAEVLSYLVYLTTACLSFDKKKHFKMPIFPQSPFPPFALSVMRIPISKILQMCWRWGRETTVCHKRKKKSLSQFFRRSRDFIANTNV